MNFVKSKDHAIMTNKHLNKLICTALKAYGPNIQRLASHVQD